MKNFYGIAVLLGLLLTSATPVFAQNWVQIGDGHYIDSQSIKSTSTYGAFTYDTKYLAKNSPLEYIGSRGVWTIKTHSYIDCRSAYAKTLSYIALDSNERIIASEKNIGKQWFGINNPGTRGYESYAFVCTDQYVNKYPNYNSMWMY